MHKDAFALSIVPILGRSEQLMRYGLEFAQSPESNTQFQHAGQRKHFFMDNLLIDVRQEHSSAIV